MANNELKRKSLAMQEGPLNDEMVLADETLRHHFGLNGGAGPVSAKGWKIINAVLALIPTPAQGGLSDVSETVLVKKSALDWLLKFNPAMCQKADMRAIESSGQQGGSDAARLALHSAVSAIYFDSSVDHARACWAVVKALAPELVEQLADDPGPVYDRSLAAIAEQEGSK